MIHAHWVVFDELQSCLYHSSDMGGYFSRTSEDQRLQRLNSLVNKPLSNIEKVLPEDSFREVLHPPSGGIERLRE